MRAASWRWGRGLAGRRRTAEGRAHCLPRAAATSPRSARDGRSRPSKSRRAAPVWHTIVNYRYALVELFHRGRRSLEIVQRERAFAASSPQKHKSLSIAARDSPQPWATRRLLGRSRAGQYQDSTNARCWGQDKARHRSRESENARAARARGSGACSGARRTRRALRFFRCCRTHTHWLLPQTRPSNKQQGPLPAAACARRRGAQSIPVSSSAVARCACLPQPSSTSLAAMRSPPDTLPSHPPPPAQPSHRRASTSPTTSTSSSSPAGRSAASTLRATTTRPRARLTRPSSWRASCGTRRSRARGRGAFT